MRNLGLDPFFKTVLCFYFYVFFFFCVSYVHLLLFVITFVFLYISTDVIIDFNFYPRINKQYININIIARCNLWRVYNTAEILQKGRDFIPAYRNYVVTNFEDCIGRTGTSINLLSTNVPVMDKPGSWFLLVKCLKSTSGRVAF